jgi:hypothetical protein
MATYKKGGTSRGAGAAKKGFDYAIYKKGGGVKKYAEGGDTGFDASKGVKEYSFADLFGKKKVPASAMDETTTRAIRETERARPAADEDREIRRPAPASESLPTAPQRRMQRRRASGPQFLPSDVAVTGPRRSRIPRPMSDAERAAEYPDLSRTPLQAQLARELEAARAAQRDEVSGGGLYRKGGVVKKAQGGSCRGMGAATRGGKYTIK